MLFIIVTLDIGFLYLILWTWVRFKYVKQHVYKRVNLFWSYIIFLFKSHKKIFAVLRSWARTAPSSTSLVRFKFMVYPWLLYASLNVYYFFWNHDQLTRRLQQYVKKKLSLDLTHFAHIIRLHRKQGSVFLFTCRFFQFLFKCLFSLKRS